MQLPPTDGGGYLLYMTWNKAKCGTDGEVIALPVCCHVVVVVYDEWIYFMSASQNPNNV